MPNPIFKQMFSRYPIVAKNDWPCPVRDKMLVEIEITSSFNRPVWDGMWIKNK